MSSAIKTDLALLKTLVEIHSGSKNPTGVDRVQAILQARLMAIGFDVELIGNPSKSQVSGKLLIARLPGLSSKWIDLVTHADTVEEGSGQSSTFTYDSQRGTAIGRGALDDKAAQVQVIQALESFVQSLNGARPAVGLRFISAPSEELGSPGFQEIFADLGRTSSFTLGFEPALEGGALISSRRGNRWYRVQVNGHGGHSGRAHASGANAALDLSKKLVAASALTDYSREVTVSIGGIQTSTQAYNVICTEAVGKLDTRFTNFQDRDQLDLKLRKIFNEPTSSADGKKSTSTAVQLEDDCPPFEESPESASWRTLIQEILEKKEGAPVGAQRSGGAADCCYMSRKGLRIIDGLGPRGGKMHEVDEFVVLASISQRAEALVEFLEKALPLLGQEK